MQKYGIIATARIFKNLVRDDYTTSVHTIINYYDDEPAYITVKDRENSVDINLNRNNNVCKAKGLLRRAGFSLQYGCQFFKFLFYQ